MAKIFDAVIEDIERGINGMNKGLPLGLPKFANEICDAQRGTYILIGADTGAGKSSFVNNSYVVEPYNYVLANPNSGIEVEYIYFSLEMKAKRQILRIIPRHLFLNYGIVTDINFVLSRGKHRISEEIYQKVKDSRDWFEKFEDKINFYDSSLTIKQMKNILEKYAERNGTVIGKGTPEISYKPKNPLKYTFIILDHNGLINAEGAMNTKTKIDDFSKILVGFRNLCEFSPVVLNQFNRDIQSNDRNKSSAALEPRLSDFKDTAGSQEDSDITIALFDPMRYKIPSYCEYDITQFPSNTFRSLSILKNRDGDLGARIGLGFYGGLGYLKELPRADELNSSFGAYERAIKLDHKVIAQEKIDEENREELKF